MRWTPAFSGWLNGPHKPLLPQLVLLTGLVGGLVAAIRWHDRRNRCLLAGCGLVVVGCWYLLITWSAAIWPHLPLLRDIQFSWRLYGPLALMLALGAAGGVRLLWPDGAARASRAHLLSVVALSSLFIGTSGWGLATQSWPILDAAGRHLGAAELRATEVGKYADGTADSGEYLPRAVEYARGSSRPMIRGQRLYESLVPERSWLGGLVRPWRDGFRSPDLGAAYRDHGRGSRGHTCDAGLPYD